MINLRIIDINIDDIYIIPDNNFIYYDEISSQLFHIKDRFL
jgi:hypothetical protein